MHAQTPAVTRMKRGPEATLSEEPFGSAAYDREFRETLGPILQ